MNSEELEKLKELKTKQTLEKMKLKYEVFLKKHGFYFINSVVENERYFYLEYKNMKGPEKLLGSIIKIWHDNFTDNTNAQFTIELSEINEYRHWKHLSIKKLFSILDEIEETGKIPY